MATPVSRRFSLVALTITAILASAHQFGQPDNTEVPAPAAVPSPAGVPSPTRPPATDAPEDKPSLTGLGSTGYSVTNDRPPLRAEKGGPFGSRRTTGSKTVALTFDDGPDPHHTPQALALLRQHRVKATFCLVGINVKAYPQLVREIVADGHTLCNHSWDHDFGLGKRSRAAIKADLIRVNEAIQAAVPGAPVAYYRQPGGNWTARVVAVARELGMTSLHWAVDPQDWRRPGPSRIANVVISGTTAGAIVLLHDAGGDRRGTVSALRTILPNLTRRFRLDALPTNAGSAENRPLPPEPRTRQP